MNLSAQFLLLQSLQFEDRAPLQFIHYRSYRHPWFQRRVLHFCYVDTQHRWWAKAVGVVKPETSIYEWKGKYRKMNADHINGLGGGSWRRFKDTSIFICEHRTNLEEAKRIFKGGQTNPATFLS